MLLSSPKELEILLRLYGLDVGDNELKRLWEARKELIILDPNKPLKEANVVPRILRTWQRKGKLLVLWNDGSLDVLKADHPARDYLKQGTFRFLGIILHLDGLGKKELEGLKRYGKIFSSVFCDYRKLSDEPKVNFVLNAVALNEFLGRCRKRMENLGIPLAEGMGECLKSIVSSLGDKVTLTDEFFIIEKSKFGVEGVNFEEYLYIPRDFNLGPSPTSEDLIKWFTWSIPCLRPGAYKLWIGSFFLNYRAVRTKRGVIRYLEGKKLSTCRIYTALAEGAKKTNKREFLRYLDEVIRVPDPYAPQIHELNLIARYPDNELINLNFKVERKRNRWYLVTGAGDSYPVKGGLSSMTNLLMYEKPDKNPNIHKIFNKLSEHIPEERLYDIILHDVGEYNGKVQGNPGEIQEH
jgi:hypothetical protein